MRTTKIGPLEWTAENLNVRNFRNGAEIPLATSLEDVLYYAVTKQPCCCYYNFDKSNEIFGLYYNWYAVSDKRYLAPEGYKIPNHLDVENLFEQLKKLNVQPYENAIIEKDVLFNKTQLNPTPAGYLCIEEEDNVVFEDLNKYAWYWTSSLLPDKDNWASVYNLHNEDWDSDFYEATLYSFNYEYSDELMGSMLAVRCVKTEDNNGIKSVADQLDDLLNGIKF